MDEQLRNRLEEAAKVCASSRVYADPVYTNMKRAYITGAEYGYKEAIAQAKEWLKDNEHFYQGGCERFPEVLSMFDTMQEMLADFEEAMNKLWEEQK